MNDSSLGRVAILIPALNEELAIRQCVESALRVPDVIVVDDGSTDGRWNKSPICPQRDSPCIAQGKAKACVMDSAKPCARVLTRWWR